MTRGRLRTRWRVAFCGLAGLFLIVVGAIAWIATRPVKAAEIAEPGPSGVRINAAGVYGNFYPSPLRGRRPAVLLLGGSEGGLGRDVRAEAMLLRAAGFNVLHLAYFNAPGRPERLVDVPLESFFHGLDWLKARRGVDPGAIGIVGYSKGAEAALLVATRYRGLRAVVAGMPSSVVWDGMSLRSYLFGGVSSWSVGGSPLPSLPYGAGDGGKALLPRFLNGLAALDQHREAVIPVERFAGRIMLVCGGRDTLWPSCLMADQVGSRLRAWGRPPVTLLRYPLAGHGVMGAPLTADDAALRKWSVLGGTANANATARRDGWPRIVAFLRGALKTEAYITER